MVNAPNFWYTSNIGTAKVNIAEHVHADIPL